MPRLGEILVARGWITRNQLLRALESQQAVGGRLGTCLLEIGVLGEEQLVQALARQLGVPAVGSELLRQVPRAVLDLLPAEVAIRYRAIPFRLIGNRVDLALADVRDLDRQDELAFFLGRGLNVHIACEARILEALSRFYGHPASPRLKRLLQRLDRSSAEMLLDVENGRLPDDLGALLPARALQAVDTDSPSGLPTPGSPDRNTVTASNSSAKPPAKRPSGPRAATPFQLSAADRAFLASPLASAGDDGPVVRLEAAGAPGEAATGTPGSVPDESREPQRPDETPEAIGAELLASLSPEFSTVILLKQHRGAVRGWVGRGDTLDGDRLAALEITSNEPSVFLNLRRGGRFFLGSLPEMPAHQRLFACFGAFRGGDCVVLPVRIGDLPAAYVYADRGAAGLAGLDLEALQVLCGRAGLALQSCALRRKSARR